MSKKQKGKTKKKIKVTLGDIEINVTELVARFLSCLDEKEVRDTAKKFFALRATEDDMHQMMRVVVINDIHEMLNDREEKEEAQKEPEVETEH